MNCKYVYISMYIIHTYICVYIFIYIYIFIHIFVLYIYTHVCVSFDKYILIHFINIPIMIFCVYKYIYICMCVYTCATATPYCLTLHRHPYLAVPGRSCSKVDCPAAGCHEYHGLTVAPKLSQAKQQVVHRLRCRHLAFELWNLTLIYLDRQVSVWKKTKFVCKRHGSKPEQVDCDPCPRNFGHTMLKLWRLGSNVQCSKKRLVPTYRPG